MAPSTLAQVLRPLTARVDPRLIVGLQTSDDAAVFGLRDDLAIIQTVDFFSPIVDDPYLFGQIAAANSLSDIYAMGGEVLFALNVAAFPDDLSPHILTSIFEGGADKGAEAGAVIAGGHTVADPEPKYGLVATGTVDPNGVWTKAGAQPGDELYLTKPLGTGIITTALKRSAVDGAQLDAAVAQMATLKLAASLAARSVDVHGFTDITGLGLLGQAWYVASKSGVRLELSAAALPLLDGAVELARAGMVAGGLGRNDAYYREEAEYPVVVDSTLDPALIQVLFDPQTSGGLFFAVPNSSAPELQRAFARHGVHYWRIGHVVNGSGVMVRP